MTSPAPLGDLAAAHPLTPPSGGKDERGTLVVVGGSATCPGGAILAGTAALRAGAGRTQLVVDPSIATAVGVAVPEALVLPWDLELPIPEVVERRLSEAQAVVIGPGLAQVPGAALDAAVACVGERPLLLDAGALEGVERHATHRGLVVAPNLDEATRLLPEDDDVPDDDVEGAAARLAGRLGRAVAVRGPATVVAAAEGRWHRDGPTVLGTPGSGDVFAGVLGGLLAQGRPPLAALAWAVEIHADAGVVLERQRRVGWLARDVLDALPEAMAARSD